LLHLINCAHKEVRGKTKKESTEAEKDNENDSEDDVEEVSDVESNQDDLGVEAVKVVDEVRQLIEFIQVCTLQFP
jgi:hypothetical protein